MKTQAAKKDKRRHGCALRRMGTLLPVLLVMLFLITPAAWATNTTPSPNPTISPPPTLNDPVGEDAKDIFPFNLIRNLFGDEVEGMTTTIEIILLLTVLTLVPSILILMTSFTRIIIVLSFTRNALGTQSMPPNQVLIGLALFLTYFTMYGTISEIVNNAWKPYQDEAIPFEEAFDNAVVPLRTFMYEQIRFQNHESDLNTYISLAHMETPATFEDIPTFVLIPAFITSELKTAFRIGFYIFIPFIVIDMVVASALMSMGMMMLPPAMISLPFKIMLFILVDGWNLVVQSVIQTFG